MLKILNVAVIFTALTIISCAMRRTGQPGNLAQGIDGYIYQVSGNQMPMKGKPRSKGKGVVRQVYIYKAATIADANGTIPLFNKINTKLIIQVTSDSTGHYKAELPVGKYSVLVKEGEKYFASETDGQGVLNPVDVTKGKIARRDVTVNVGAAY